MRAEPFSIDVEDDGETLVIRPTGELDATTSPQLVEAFSSSETTHRTLVCDVTDITFIDSTGIQAFLRLADREPERFAIAGSSQPVERLLEITGTAGLFRRVAAR